MPETDKSAGNNEEYGYLAIPNPGLDLQWPQPETGMEKLKRKVKENPFVPIGLGVTTFALIYGLWQMKSGNKQRSQQMMRLRVGAQSFTVVALLGGVLYSAQQKKAERLAAGNK